MPIVNGKNTIRDLLEALGELGFSLQSGLIYPTHSETVDYFVSSICTYDGISYQSIQESGPNKPSGVVIPTVTPNWNQYWEAVLTFVKPDGITLIHNQDGTLTATSSAAPLSGYITEFRNFFEQVPFGGWAIRNGGVLTNADIAYPALWEALHSSKYAWKCITLEEWIAKSDAAGGVGGVPFFVVDDIAKTIKLPDSRGDYERGAGSSFLLNVGDWHPDAIRDITGQFEALYTGSTGAFKDGTREISWQGSGTPTYQGSRVSFAASEVVPTAGENRVRGYALLPCVFVGGNS